MPTDREISGAKTYTSALILQNPPVEEASESTITTFNILVYQGTVMSYKVFGEDMTIESTYVTRNFFDDVFDLLTSASIFQRTETSSVSILNSQRLKSINIKREDVIEAIVIVQTNNIQDTVEIPDADQYLHRTTYTSDAIAYLQSAISSGGTLLPQTGLESSMPISVNSNNTYSPNGAYNYYLQEFTDGLALIKGVRLLSINNQLVNKIIFGLTNEENNRLKHIIVSRSLINSRLFLLDLFESGNHLISRENIAYKKYRAVIAADSPENSSMIYMPDVDIIVYSLDGYYHFTEAYSRYMKQSLEVNLNDLTIDLTL